MTGVRERVNVSSVLRASASLLVCFAGAFACESDANDCAALATCGTSSASDGGSSNGDAGSDGLAGAGQAGAEEGGTGGQAGGGGEAGGDGLPGAGRAGGGGEGGGCDPSSAPAEDACVLDDASGVFVSPNGDDESGDGSRSAPFKTLSRAILASLERGRRVYACASEGAYRETLELDELASGLELYGGLACDDFRYTGEKALVTSTDRQALLAIANMDGFRAEDFAFVAGDAEAFGASSIGAFVANSRDIEFRRVRIEAGRGAAGVHPTRTNHRYLETSALAGRDATGTNGGDERVCECPDGSTTTGGRGGDGETLGQAGKDGLPPYGGGAGGTAEVCDLEPARGADAPVLAAGAGASAWGELDDEGWTPAAGIAGEQGAPGQGGGGGGAVTVDGVLLGGGGGGCGGCGGAGGPGGGGGGASIALAVLASSVTLERAELVATDAGDGGNGSMGQAAQMGRGEGGVSEGGCNGGEGGLGADGAAGGGGAGGVSLGILFRGERPELDPFTAVAFGAAGVAGTGGDPGQNDGVVGLARAVFELPSPELTDP